MSISPLLEPRAERADVFGDARLPRIWNASLWVALLVVAAYHVVLHGKTLVLEEPMGSWETVYAHIARVWPGQYQWEHHVEGHDGYGPGYPTFVRPFLATGLDIYVAHRLAGLIALIAACVIVAVVLRSKRVPPVATAALTTIFYALNAGTYSVQARPDFLALFEIAAMLALGELVVRGKVKLGVGFGIAFGVLALAGFFTKAYAIFTAAAVLGYLIIFVSWRRAIAPAAIAATIVILGVVSYAGANPLYALEVFRGQIVQAAPSVGWFFHQAGDFALLACGLVVPVIAGIAARVFTSSQHAGARPGLGPVGADAKFWRWQLVIALGGLAIGPGWHTGAYLTYFLHLALVPLVFVAAEALTRTQRRARVVVEVALFVNLAVLTITAPGLPRPDPQWSELKRDVHAESGRVAVDYLLEPIARALPRVAVVSTGQTGYVLREPFFMPADNRTAARARASADQYVAGQRQLLFGPSPVDVIYLDCLFLRGTDDNAGRFSLHPRSELPYFQGPEMKGYVATKIYTVTPFYFSTNARRQTAGTLRTSIVRFVRKTTGIPAEEGRREP